MDHGTLALWSGKGDQVVAGSNHVAPTNINEGPSSSYACRAFVFREGDFATSPQPTVFSSLSSAATACLQWGKRARCLAHTPSSMNGGQKGHLGFSGSGASMRRAAPSGAKYTTTFSAAAPDSLRAM